MVSKNKDALSVTLLNAKLNLTVEPQSGMYYCYHTSETDIMGSYGNTEAEAIGYYILKIAGFQS